MDLGNLQRQHKEIETQIRNIEGSLTKEYVINNAFDLSMSINRLAGIINIHLKSEDEFLYPSLNKLKDEKVSAISQQFSQEMGGLAQSFTLYKNNYRIASQIKEQPLNFINSTKEIFSHLKRRIENENSILYPLLSK